jgi:hypothetical protein
MAKLSKIHPDDLELESLGRVANSRAPEELCAILFAALDEAIGRGEADQAVTFAGGVPVAVNIPGVLRFEVLDLAFAKRARRASF